MNIEDLVKGTAQIATVAGFLLLSTTDARNFGLGIMSYAAVMYQLGQRENYRLDNDKV